MSYDQFKFTYNISPIILTGGIAGDAGAPLIKYLQPNFSTGVSTGYDDYFAQFEPLPGATLIDNQIGMYPFANQTVAANAIITNPLRISLMMICPVRDAGGYAAKLSAITALQKTLMQHNISGGTYSVATPSYLYTECVMTGMRDAGNNSSKQAQVQWQIDFLQPLITLEAAQQAQNQLMKKISSGTQITGDPPTATNQAA